MDTQYAIVIEHLDASVSTNGPYDSYDEAVEASHWIADYEAKQLGTIVEHEEDGATVGNDEAGEDTMSIYVRPLGEPVTGPIT